MNEITCSQCGAVNPGQSKYCNKCGASLGDESTHICPSCGKDNPLTLLYCDHCGTRLIDDTTSGPQPEEADQDDDIARSEPFSLPSRPPGQTGNLEISSELPDWLKTGEFSTAREESGTERTEEPGHPEWLRAAHEGQEWDDEEAPTLEELSQDHKPQDDLPTWLLDETSADHIFSGDKSTDELFMASLASDDDDAPRETGSVLRDELPEWLQGLSTPEHDEAPPGDETPSPQSSDPDRQEDATGRLPHRESDTVSELRNWLSDMEEDEAKLVEGESGEPGRPAQVSEDSDDSIIDSGPQTKLEAEDDFLNWLSEIQEDVTSEDELSSDPGSDPLQHTGLPAWLDDSDVAADLDDADPGGDTGDEDQAPAWLFDLPDEPFENARPEARSTPAPDAPDWMEVEQSSAEAEVLPDTLQPMRDEDESGAVSEFSADDIEMVRSDESDDARSNKMPKPADPVFTKGEDDVPAQEMPEDEFLQWLDSLDISVPAVGATEQQADESENTTAEPETESHGTENRDEFEPETDARLPDWLGEFAEAEDDSTDSAIADVDALPDWLRDLAPPGSDVTLPYVSVVEDEGEATPTETFEAVKPEQPIGHEPVSEPIDPSDKAAFPDWLDGVTDELGDAPDTAHSRAEELERAGEEKDLPADDEKRLPDRGELRSEVRATDLDIQGVPQEDLPDWFSDVLMSIEAQDASESPQASPTLTNVPEQLAGEELPPWLDSPFSDETVAEPTPIDEIPEWLRAPLKERLARIVEERGLDESALESGDEWRELLESSVTDSEDSQSAPASATDAWLASLRAQASSDIEVVDRADEDKEGADSPIAELPGTISIAPVVARTAKRNLVTHVDDQDQAQQAMLLRQLARSQQDASGSVIASVPHESKLPVPVHVLLSILLLAAVVMGLLASDRPVNSRGEPPLDSVAPMGAQMLAITTDKPVLLVVDYTPALAGALQPSAATVVREVGLEGNHLLVTSQTAAGLGLAHQILDATDASQVDALGFIPGGAAGVRRLGRCMESTANCDDLFGQPIAPPVADRLADVAHVVVVTGDRDNLTAWIEQLSDIQIASLVAIVTPAIQPVAAPYLATGQLSNLGVAMGLSVGDNSIMDMTASPALRFAHWLVLISIAGGAIYYLAIGALRSRRI